ncbi:hypothetical protein CH63R_08404 [Colletotrichum higginsianum IMI 349063]|uniref:Uncharacterized protein n=1 Tax=Colletotrichum higginsianum (strain IMI 349063) TaxID=759273 RepID=A0A1B7YC56_COLHI|nr:hypothetical protein CH63R_08404 [Colletotrichum higginsianum IMI 349063]OBR09639.1 hypothetical protein CH63R_08404 [Colletotrichum higginsianum IMI 349063]
MQVKIVSVLFAVGALIAPAFACLPAGHACTIGAANDCCFSADCERKLFNTFCGKSRKLTMGINTAHPGHENPGAIGACGH